MCIARCCDNRWLLFLLLFGVRGICRDWIGMVVHAARFAIEMLLRFIGMYTFRRKHCELEALLIQRFCHIGMDFILEDCARSVFLLIPSIMHAKVKEKRWSVRKQ